MSPNFCPHCGHRVYQHDHQGCQHYELVLRDCTDPDCKPDVLVTKGGTHAHQVPEKCDCTTPHPLLVALRF